MIRVVRASKIIQLYSIYYNIPFLYYPTLILSSKSNIVALPSKLPSLKTPKTFAFL